MSKRMTSGVTEGSAFAGLDTFAGHLSQVIVLVRGLEVKLLKRKMESGKRKIKSLFIVNQSYEPL